MVFSFDFDFRVNDEGRERIARELRENRDGAVRWLGWTEPKVDRNTRIRSVRSFVHLFVRSSLAQTYVRTYTYIRGDISDEAKYLRENFAVGGAAS